MNMYATLAFTTFAAYGALAITSLILIVLVANVLIPRSELEKSLEKLEAYRNGYSTKTDWRKVGVILAIWFASGWYLFG